MRMMITSGNSIRKVLLAAALGFLLIHPSVAPSQTQTHVVEKGDTLWNLCEKYYGDPELWPKLWEMNPFVTNPHLLKPGDVIRLMDKPAAKPAPLAKEPPGPVQVVEERRARPSGIHLPGMTIPGAAGFLTLQRPIPMGTVYASDSEKLMLSKGDSLFLDFGENEGVKAGDFFAVSRLSAPLEHPFKLVESAYLVSPRAKVVVKERARKNIFRSEIVEQYADSGIGDMVLPFVSASPCLKPLPVEKELRGIIAALQNQQEHAGRYSIVYLDCGSDTGLKPGHLLEILRIRTVPDPAVPPPISENWLLELFKVKTFEELWAKLSRESVLYELVIGHMMVLEVRPDTTTAIILDCKENIRKGAIFRGIPSAAPPAFLSSLPSCEVK